MFFLATNDLLLSLEYRMDEKRTVRNIKHEIPWTLKSQETVSGSKKAVVQVVEGLSADRIDMSVVRDEFIPAAFSFSGRHGFSAHGPPKLLYNGSGEFRLRPKVVKSDPRAKETRFESDSATRMNVKSPAIPN